MKKKFFYLFLFFNLLKSNWYEQKLKFDLKNVPIDVTITCHKKDKDILIFCIRSIKQYVENLGRIIVISEEKFTDEAEWFDEKNFPFSKKSVEEEFASIDANFYNDIEKINRVGWYFKQLMVLHSSFVIPNISENILNVDADIVFLKPVVFVDKNGNMLHAPGTENHIPYFEHIGRVLPGLKKALPDFSGISHHILIQRPILKDLFSLVENYHKMPFWRVYCRSVDINHIANSGSADYEIYFNFAVIRTDQVIIRHLKWDNIRRLSEIKNYNNIHDYDFISSHKYARFD